MADKDRETKTISRFVDRPSLEIGSRVFPADQIQSARISFRINQFEESRSATIVLATSPGGRWNYHAEAKLYECGETLLTGICSDAKLDDQGNIRLTLHGPFWMLERTRAGSFETFGMSKRESLYWMLKLSPSGRDPVFQGLELDESPRPFLYAIPIRGFPDFSNKLFFAGDIGITSKEKDSVFNPILEAAESIQAEQAWSGDNARIFGLVIAENLVEAERLASERAKSLIGIINLGMTTCMSHFETRYSNEPLSYSGEDSFSPVSLHPWITISEVSETKGWVRKTLPATLEPERRSDNSLQRIEFFLSKFFSTGKPGDIYDQTRQRQFPEREQKLLTRTERALHWLNLANEGGDIRDKFTAVWTSLEAILNSIKYPGVFDGERASVKKSLRRGIKEIELPLETNKLLSITTEMLLNRTLQNQWPMTIKLSIFADAFGITLEKDDIALVGKLGRLRSDVFHEGQNNPDVTAEQVSQLRNLVQRLVAATSIGGYEDIEDRPHSYQIGEIGPEGGGAPLSIDGKDVDWEINMYRDNDGKAIVEWLAEGKIYTRENIHLEGNSGNS